MGHPDHPSAAPTMHRMNAGAGVERVARDVAIGISVGLVSGIGSYAFLEGLDWATRTRVSHGWLLWLLPLAGIAIGVVYLHLGGESAKGTNLILDEWHDPTDMGPPKRMAPLVLVGTTATQLFGGSVGREGAAVQIAASLTSLFRRWIAPEDRRAVMVAAIAGGFGSVFGVPAAGAVFALEVPHVGRTRYNHVVAALLASFVGDRYARQLGTHHTVRGPVALDMDIAVALKLCAAASAFALCSVAFVELTHLLKRALTKRISYAPIRPALGGVVTVALTVGFGTRAYLGLSLPLLDSALAGLAVGSTAFVLKLVFTSVAVGSGFPGGEVTPLFCMGACLGSILAGPLRLDKPALAAIGMVTVFAAAANTPITCALVGIELFGGGATFAFVFVPILATVMSGDRSVYGRQRVHRSTGIPGVDGEPTTMGALDSARAAAIRERLKRR